MKQLALALLLSMPSLHAQESMKFLGVHKGEILNTGSASIYNNFAFSKVHNNTQLFLSMTNKFGLKNLNQIAIAYSKPRENKILGIGYQFDEEGNWLKHHLKTAIQMNYSERWYFAPSLNLFFKSLTYPESSSSFNASISFGIAYIQNPNLKFGLQSSNFAINNQDISKFEIAPSLQYSFEQNLHFGLEAIIQNNPSTINTKLSALLLVDTKKSLYMNYSLLGNYFTLGISISQASFNWSLLLSHHPSLDYSSSIEINKFWP